MSDREAERQKRLREALRENLKRRKAQARGRTACGGNDDKTAHALSDDSGEESA